MSFPSRPSRAIVPLVGRTSVAKAVRREVFPAPLGPRSAWNPGPSDHDTSSTAQVLPYETVRWETVKCGMRNSRSDDFRHDWRIEDIPYRACLRTRAPACPGPCRYQGIIGLGDEVEAQYRQVRCRLVVSAPTPYGSPTPHTEISAPHRSGCAAPVSADVTHAVPRRCAPSRPVGRGWGHAGW